jgi:hypothetical protein
LHLTSGGPANYPAGRVVYLWRWDGWAYPDGLGTGATRYTVVDCDLEGVFTLDAPPPTDPAFAGSVKWLDGRVVGDCAEGDSAVRCREAGYFAVGNDVLVTDGPSIANEAAGEFRRVVAIERDLITLDRPLRRAFRNAALAKVAPVAGPALANLTLDVPTNGQAECGLFKFCRGVRLDRVEVRGALSLASCWDVVLSDCTVGGLALNNCHDVAVHGGRYGSVWGEEGCHDILLDGALVACDPLAGEAQNGIGQGSEGGCERWTLRGVRLEGFPNSPFGLGGRENAALDVTVANSRPVAQPGNVYVNGDDTRVDGLRSDRPVVFLNGRRMTAAHVRAPWVSLGWVNGMTSAGIALDCGPSPTVQPESTWAVVG